jgi:3-oxoadipate CoA-transferase alpha subunit
MAGGIVLAQEKVYAAPATALADISEGAVILVSGFAGCGVPTGLLQGLADSGVGGLTCIFSHASIFSQARGPAEGEGGDALTPGPSPPGRGGSVAQLVANGQVRKLISPLPFTPGSGGIITERWQAGDLEIEVVPQGILVERLRAGGAGIGGVFLPTGIGVRFETGKEKRSFQQGEALLELPLKADFALIKVAAADTLGSVIYAGTTRNWAPVMAMAARITIAEADRIVEPGGLDPEAIITPGIFVNRIVASA